LRRINPAAGAGLHHRWHCPPVAGAEESTVSHARTVVWTDHQAATVLSFEADHVQTEHVRAHHHPTAQHASGVRSEHAFFAALCAALEGDRQVLVTGGHTALADFRHYVDKHRPLTAARIAGYEVAAHPTDRQLLALARDFFDRHERLAAPALHPSR
jgi:hypothetical protein